MGIKGLWQALQPYIQDGHLSQFKGKRVSVDMYVWLHQAIRHGTELNGERIWRHFQELDARGEGMEKKADEGPEGALAAGALAVEDLYRVNDRYIDYVVQKVDALLRHGAIPVCVFDGAEMPMKRQTNAERRGRREASFRQALRLLEGNFRRARAARRRGFQTHARSYAEALECVWKAVDISTELAHALIQVLREERRVECLVAPYEAEAQMAYLCRQGYVAAALSEDSDLIAYYCPCIIAKVEAASGRCVVVRPQVFAPVFFSAMAAMNLPQRSRARGDGGGLAEARPLNSAAPPSPTTASPAGAPVAFSYESFLLGCIMSGCDYLVNLRSIGVKTAFKLVSHARSLAEVLQLLQTQFGFPADELQGYRGRLLDAFYCFAHHIVYDPSRRGLVTFFPLPNASSSSSVGLREDLVGAMWSDEDTHRVCEECLFDPNTHRLYVGAFDSCLHAYFRRTRRGQARLTNFGGFNARQAPKVVLEAKQARVEEEEGDFASPFLQKVREAAGFLAKGTPKVMVRSKYFLRLGRLHAQEDWSASSGNSIEGGGLVGGSQDSACRTEQFSDSTTAASERSVLKSQPSPTCMVSAESASIARTPLTPSNRRRLNEESTSSARASSSFSSPQPLSGGIPEQGVAEPDAASPPILTPEKALASLRETADGEATRGCPYSNPSDSIFVRCAHEIRQTPHRGIKRERTASKDDLSTSAHEGINAIDVNSERVGKKSYFERAFKAPRRVETTTASSQVESLNGASLINDDPESRESVDTPFESCASPSGCQPSKSGEITKCGLESSIFEQLSFTSRHSATV